MNEKMPEPAGGLDAATGIINALKIMIPIWVIACILLVAILTN